MDVVDFIDNLDQVAEQLDGIGDGATRLEVVDVLPQSKLEFSWSRVSIAPIEGEFHERETAT